MKEMFRNRAGPVLFLLAGTALVLAQTARPGGEPPLSESGPPASTGTAGGGGGRDGAPLAEASAVAAPRLALNGATESELRDLRGLLDDRPDDAPTLLRLAQLLQETRRANEAAPLYERYLELRPHSPGVWLNLASAYSATARWDRAADASLRMLEYFPDDAAAMYSLGAALANQGRYEDARGWWERVLEADDPVMMGRALRALERLAEL